MVRLVKQEEYDAKRAEILDAAQRLVLSKGYERMTIQDILGDLGMSNGAFYHYFPTKPAVMEALIERMLHSAEQPLLAILHDPRLSALDKLQGFFATLGHLRSANKSFLVDLLRVWYADDNAIVRQKVEAATAVRRAALLAEVIRQGIQEGVFETPYPDQAGEVVHALATGMDNSIARLMLSFEQASDRQRLVESVVAAHDAYIDAIERLLSIPSASLQRADPQAVRAVIAELRVDPRN